MYVIDPSACLVYTPCARLRPEQTLTFHTRGSSPSLSRVIVQLRSQLKPIMWEFFTDDSGGKTLRPVWVGPLRGKEMFSSDVPVHIVSSPLAEGLFMEEDVCGRQRGVLCSHHLMNQLLRWSRDPQLTSVNSAVQRLSLKLVANPHLSIRERRCKLAVYWQETGRGRLGSDFLKSRASLKESDTLNVKNISLFISSSSHFFLHLEIFWFHMIRYE